MRGGLGRGWGERRVWGGVGGRGEFGGWERGFPGRIVQFSVDVCVFKDFVDTAWSRKAEILGRESAAAKRK